MVHDKVVLVLITFLLTVNLSIESADQTIRAKKSKRLIYNYLIKALKSICDTNKDTIILIFEEP